MQCEHGPDALVVERVRTGRDEERLVNRYGKETCAEVKMEEGRKIVIVAK